MGVTTRHTLQFKVCIILIFITLAGYYLLRYREEEVIQAISQLQHGEKETFIQISIQTANEGAFDIQPIRELCGNTTWTDGLIFQCDSPQGGVGNVENFFMNCIRYAIEAGAAFIVPEIMIRSPKDLSDLTTNELVEFSYLFDRAHFKSSLAEGCPQMTLYDSINDLYNFPTTAKPILLNPHDLTTEFVHGRVLAQPAKWRASFDAFLKSHTSRVISSASPVIVQIHNVLLEFPLSYDTIAFAHNFGGIFRFREDARRLAASILFTLSTKFSAHLNPGAKIIPNTFLGAHLRTASDAMKAGWPGYESQAGSYLAQAAEHNLSTIYVASGSAPHISRFRSDAALQNCTVVTKEDFLADAELEALRGLTWDQQALVDFEVLAKSSQFAGIEQSSFAWKIALRRHLLSVTDDYLSGTQALEDEFSVIYGGGQMGYFPLALWP